MLNITSFDSCSLSENRYCWKHVASSGAEITKNDIVSILYGICICIYYTVPINKLIQSKSQHWHKIKIKQRVSVSNISQPMQSFLNSLVGKIDLNAKEYHGPSGAIPWKWHLRLIHKDAMKHETCRKRDYMFGYKKPWCLGCTGQWWVATELWKFCLFVCLFQIRFWLVSTEKLKEISTSHQNTWGWKNWWAPPQQVKVKENLHQNSTAVCDKMC